VISSPDQPKLRIGPWTAELRTGRLTDGSTVRAVEPKVMDLLFLLGSQPGRVFSRDEVMEALWPGVTVGDDTLARSVSKLRKALGDEAGAARYIETIPKRGYRLIERGEAPPAADRPARRPPRLWTAIAVVVVAAMALGIILLRPNPHSSPAEALIARADDDYFQYTPGQNEAAIALYHQALAVAPDDPPALAGLANATVQKAIRWPNGPGAPGLVRPSLTKALSEGLTRTPAAVRILSEARSLADRAVQSGPREPAAWKALGFVRSAQGDFAGAKTAYDRALGLDPDAWGVMINLGELEDLQGRPQAGLAMLERAYAAMTRSYEREPARIRPWQASLGVLIAERHVSEGRLDLAAGWYRRVLAAGPFDPAATVGLAGVMRRTGDALGAQRLCRELAAHTGAAAGCPAT
jgi:DNA-binding winged helix-turn-helix (wHTH) protein/Tfp pilus assembly protein PilF